MQPGWIPQIFETCELGVSTAYEAELIPDNQLVWMKNGTARGGKAQTRPFLKFRLQLPTGRVQGVSFFSIQNGMLISQIAGHVYRIRIANKSFTCEEIPLTFLNSAAIPQVWMQETVGSMVIQDGQSLAIIFDGSTARRSDPAKEEVPLGRMMAYGNGRLWEAINDNELVAGDIKTKAFQSEIFFTEGQYFSGGGAFYFPFKIIGLAFIPATGADGYGSLMVFGEAQTQGVRADIASRDLWPNFPGFIQPILLSSGAISHYSIVQANQDLFWRDGDGGIRSIRSSASEEVAGPGNAPNSREVSRITDYESVHRLGECSSIHFNDRLLMTASPFINIYGTTSYRNLISLDFSPLSSLRGKQPPCYDGQWEGINFVRLVNGKFQNVRRAFAISTDDDGLNRLWEITPQGTADEYEACDDGTLTLIESPVPMVLEYPSRNFGDPKRRKRLERCDVYLAGLNGESELSVYWRADNNQQWTMWDDVKACATTTDDSTLAPHVWKNLQTQERPQTMTFSIPDGENLITQRALHVGFEFEVRIVLRGKGKIYRTVVYASMLDEQQFADRDATFETCIQNDVTNNEILYKLEPSLCPNRFILDKTGINLLWQNIPVNGGGQSYYPPHGFSVAFRGVALWVSDEQFTTARTLLNVWDAATFDTTGFIDYTAFVKAHVATGTVRRLFFTVLGAFGNGGTPFYELPTQVTIESFSGDIGTSNQQNVDNAGYTFMIAETISTGAPVATMNNMGVLRSGDYLTDDVTHGLAVFLPALPIGPPPS